MFERWLHEQRAIVEAHLERSLPPASAHPERIHEALRYAVLSGGKRLRPVLVLATTELVGGKPQSVLDAAAAVELIHIATLVLDDLPSMDDAHLRHGCEPTHRRYGEATAILAAIALLVHAYALVATNADRLRLKRSRLAAVIQAMSAATGSEGLVGGQIKDLELSGGTAEGEAAGGGPLPLRTLEYIHSRKTGHLFVLAATLGPMLHGASEADVEALRSYARNVGLAYQIVDDLLDRYGTASELGKDVGQDRDRSTFASLMAEDDARRLVAELVETARGWVRPFGRRARWLEAFAATVEKRRS